MADNPIEFSFEPAAEHNVFIVSGKAVYNPDKQVPGSLVFNITNSSGDWIDVVGESYHPVSDRLFTTGKMDNGATATEVRQLAPYLGRSILLTRWAPGIFRIPGNGGGEVRFTLPSAGDVTIDITITKPR